MRAHQVAFLVLLPLVALHCGESNGGGSPQAPSAGAVSVEEFERRYVQASCDGADVCCKKGGGVLGDAATCPTSVAAYLTSLREASAKEGFAFDGAVAGECIAVIESAYAACRAPSDAALGGVCELVFHGTKAQGEKCSGSDCGRTGGGQLLRCARAAASSGAPRSCQPVSAQEADLGPAGRAGDICRSTCEVDEDGGSGCYTTDGDNIPAGARTCLTNDNLYCDDQTCVAQLGAGAPCTASYACGAGLRCSAPDACTAGTPGCGEPGTCIAELAIGDACDPKADACPGTARCSGSSNVCEPGKKPGDACDPKTPDCGLGRCDDGVCVDRDDLTHASACEK